MGKAFDASLGMGNIMKKVGAGGHRQGTLE